MLINDANLALVAQGFKTVYNEHFDATETLKDTLAMTVGSQGAEENYGWFGQFPELREWIGSRQLKELSSHGFSIKNRKFESTVRVQRDDISDDKFGVYKPMFSEMGRVSKIHPDKMIFALLANGFEVECYDGQPFFDPDHPMTVPEVGETVVSNVQDGAGEAWYLLDLSKAIKPIIWQEREKYEFQMITDPKSTTVFMEDEYLYGVRARVNCGFGLWQLGFASKDELNAENYAAARAAMSKFGGDHGQKLGITATHLVVPSTLETAARTLLKADTLDGTSNIWKGTAELIVTTWL